MEVSKVTPLGNMDAPGRRTNAKVSCSSSPSYWSSVIAGTLT